MIHYTLVHTNITLSAKYEKSLHILWKKKKSQKLTDWIDVCFCENHIYADLKNRFIITHLNLVASIDKIRIFPCRYDSKDWLCLIWIHLHTVFSELSLFWNFRKVTCYSQRTFSFFFWKNKKETHIITWAKLHGLCSTSWNFFFFPIWYKF